MNSSEVDRKLEEWGRRLLYPGVRRFGRPGTDPRPGNGRVVGLNVRAGLKALARRAPEVMVKVTGGGRGMGAIRAHFQYISRRGKLELLTDDGDRIWGREEVADLVEEWATADVPIPTKSHRREAFHVMFSMPSQTDTQTVLSAAQGVAQEEFANHHYAMVLHDPAVDPDSARPHVHLIVRARGRDGRRLNPRKADLARWRCRFAERLNERGVAASATRRQARGELQPAKTLLDHHVGGIERKAWPITGGENALSTEKRALAAWGLVINALAESQHLEDQRLASALSELVRQMPAVKRRQQRMARAAVQARGVEAQGPKQPRSPDRLRSFER